MKRSRFEEIAAVSDIKSHGLPPNNFKSTIQMFPDAHAKMKDIGALTSQFANRQASLMHKLATVPKHQSDGSLKGK